MLKKLTALVIASVFMIFAAPSALADDAGNSAPEQQESMQKPADNGNSEMKAEDEAASKDANDAVDADSSNVSE